MRRDLGDLARFDRYGGLAPGKFGQANNLCCDSLLFLRAVTKRNFPERTHSRVGWRATARTIVPMAARSVCGSVGQAARMEARSGSGICPSLLWSSHGWIPPVVRPNRQRCPLLRCSTGPRGRMASSASSVPLWRASVGLAFGPAFGTNDGSFSTALANSYSWRCE